MKIPRAILAAGATLLLLTGSVASAADKDVVQLQVDVAKLQRTVQDLQTSVDTKNAAILQQMGKLADQTNNLTESLRKLTDLVGTIKADNAAASANATANASRSANEIRDALVPLIGELRKSIDDVKSEQASSRSQMKALSDQLIAMKSTSEPLPTCKDIKQDADRSANSGYYDDAISGYRDFISKSECKSDPKAAEVQLAIADSEYSLKKFDQAITDYDIFLAKYPTSDKVASALLRKGLAHAELNQKDEARAALTRVTTEFKGTSEASTAAAKIKELGPAATGRGARGKD